MSYTNVRAMRSNRYPLMGAGDCGCGCGGGGGCGDGIGSLGELDVSKVAGYATIGLTGLGLFYLFASKPSGVRANRRRRRRRR